MSSTSLYSLTYAGNPSLPKFKAKTNQSDIPAFGYMGKEGEQLNDGFGLAGSILGTAMQAHSIATDTGHIENWLDQYTDAYNRKVDASSTSSLMADALNNQDLYMPSKEELGKINGGQAAGQIGTAALQNAMAGAKFGWGAALAAGIAGALTEGAGILTHNIGINKDAERLKNAKLYAENSRSGIINEAGNIANQNVYNTMMQNYVNSIKCGGKLHKFDMGGGLDNNVNIIGNGNKHEANPYGGVPQGVDNQGVPNLVEEGEVVFKLNGEDYVLSNDPSLRVKYKEKKQPSNADLFLKKYDGMTFAEAGKKAQRESEERPNDKISNDTKDFMMSTLYNEQERIKQQRAENKFKRQLNKLPEEQQMALMDSITQQNQEQEANEMAMQEEQAMQDPMYQQMLQQQMIQQGMMKFGGKICNKFATGGDMYSPDWREVYKYGEGASNPSDDELETALQSLAMYYNNDITRVKEALQGIDYAKRNTFAYKDTEGNVHPLFKTSGTGYTDDYMNSKVWNWLKSTRGQEFFNQYWANNNSLTKNYYGSSGNTAPTLENVIGDIGQYKQDYQNATRHGAYTAGAFDDRYSDMHKFILAAMYAAENDNTDWEKSIPAINTETPEPKTNPVTNPTEGDKKDLDLGFPVFQPKKTWLRYAPVALGGAAMLTDALGLTNKPDYSMFDGLIKSSSNGVNGFMPVRFNPIGDYMRYRPYDVNYERNRIDANTQAANRALTDLSNASAANKEAAIIANTYAGQLAQGEAYKRAFDTNWERYRAMKEFNRGTNQFNSQYGLQADMANAGNFANAVNRNYQNNVAAMQLKWEAKKLADQGRAANINNFVTSLQGIGTENLNYNKALFDLMTGNPIRKEFYPTVYAMMGQYKKGKQLAKLMQKNPNKDISELLEELNA